MGMRMYDYNSQYVELEELLIKGEITQDQFQDTLESFSDDMLQKAENVAKMAENFDVQERILKEEEDKLKAKRNSIKKKKEWLEQDLMNFLKALGRDEYQVGIFRLTYDKKPPRVELVNEKVIPKAYKVPQDPKIDKRAISKALKDGETVRGAKLITDERTFKIKK